MYNVIRSPDPEKNLRRMVTAVRESLSDAPTATAALANASAFIMAYMPGLNWAGFYLMQDGRLALGPFQGMPACTEIALGAGVCGTAAQERRNVRVDDVHAFPGHIACDSASASELVLPLYRGGEVCGVIDLDSPDPGRFTALDEQYLDQVARLIDAYLEDTHA